MKHLDTEINKYAPVILVADDEPPVLNMLIDLLTSCNFRVISAEDGEIALQKFKEHREQISLCMIDAMMPNLTGDQVFFMIREIDPEVPVLFISGYSCEEDCLFENNIGMMSKPLKIGPLLQMIEDLLSANVALSK